MYEVVVRHIDLLRKPQPGTIAKYRNMATAHIADSDLGKTPVDKINKAAVIDWLDELKVQQGANQTVGEPLSRKTKQNVHALLSAAFVTAMDSEVMHRNPAKGVAEADLNEAREAVVVLPRYEDVGRGPTLGEGVHVDRPPAASGTEAITFGYLPYVHDFVSPAPWPGPGTTYS